MNKRTLTDSEMHAHYMNRHAQRSLQETLTQIQQMEINVRDSTRVEIQKLRQFQKENIKNTGWSPQAMRPEAMEDEFIFEQPGSPSVLRKKTDDVKTFQRPWFYSFNQETHNKVYKELTNNAPKTKGAKSTLYDDVQARYMNGKVTNHPQLAQQVPAVTGTQRAKTAWTRGRLLSGREQQPSLRPATSYIPDNNVAEYKDLRGDDLSKNNSNLSQFMTESVMSKVKSAWTPRGSSKLKLDDLEDAEVGDQSKESSTNSRPSSRFADSVVAYSGLERSRSIWICSVCGGDRTPQTQDPVMQQTVLQYHGVKRAVSALNKRLSISKQAQLDQNQKDEIKPKELRRCSCGCPRSRTASLSPNSAPAIVRKSKSSVEKSDSNLNLNSLNNKNNGKSNALLKRQEVNEDQGLKQEVGGHEGFSKTKHKKEKKAKKESKKSQTSQNSLRNSKEENDVSSEKIKSSSVLDGSNRSFAKSVETAKETCTNSHDKEHTNKEEKERTVHEEDQEADLSSCYTSELRRVIEIANQCKKSAQSAKDPSAFHDNNGGKGQVSSSQRSITDRSIDAARQTEECDRISQSTKSKGMSSKSTDQVSALSDSNTDGTYQDSISDLVVFPPRTLTRGSSIITSISEDQELEDIPTSPQKVQSRNPIERLTSVDSDAGQSNTKRKDSTVSSIASNAHPRKRSSAIWKILTFKQRRKLKEDDSFFHRVARVMLAMKNQRQKQRAMARAMAEARARISNEGDSDSSNENINDLTDEQNYENWLILCKDPSLADVHRYAEKMQPRDPNSRRSSNNVNAYKFEQWSKGRKGWRKSILFHSAKDMFEHGLQEKNKRKSSVSGDKDTNDSSGGENTQNDDKPQKDGKENENKDTKKENRSGKKGGKDEFKGDDDNEESSSMNMVSLLRTGDANVSLASGVLDYDTKDIDLISNGSGHIYHKGVRIKNYVRPQVRYKSAARDSQKKRNTSVRWSSGGGAMVTAHQFQDLPQTVDMVFPKQARQRALAKMIEENHTQPLDNAAELAEAALRKRIDTFLESVEPYCPKKKTDDFFD